MTATRLQRTVVGMTLAESQAGHVPRETTQLATRAASLGLAGVVLCLAAFSIFGAYTVRTQIGAAEREESLRVSYEQALIAIRAEDSSLVEYMLDPSSELHAAMNAGTNALIDAMNEIEVQGRSADSELAKEMMAVHDDYVQASVRLLSAMDAGNPAEALRIERFEVDPIFDKMHARITAEVEARSRFTASAFAESEATARWLLIESPVIFAIGFALLFGLWRILEQSHRAARETYRQIEQLSKLRSEFVSIVSHEFRTPLTGIQGFSELIRDEELSPAQIREYAATSTRMRAGWPGSSRTCLISTGWNRAG